MHKRKHVFIIYKSVVSRKLTDDLSIFGLSVGFVPDGCSKLHASWLADAWRRQSHTLARFHTLFIGEEIVRVAIAATEGEFVAGLRFRVVSGMTGDEVYC